MSKEKKPHAQRMAEIQDTLEKIAAEQQRINHILMLSLRAIIASQPRGLLRVPAGDGTSVDVFDAALLEIGREIEGSPGHDSHRGETEKCGLTM